MEKITRLELCGGQSQRARGGTSPSRPSTPGCCCSVVLGVVELRL